MRLPDPPLLLVTDRAQARRPLAEIVAAALAGGCRWVSLRKRICPRTSRSFWRASSCRWRANTSARLMLHGEAALAKMAGVDGVHLPSGSDAAAARALMGPESSSACRSTPSPRPEAIDPHAADYALAGPAFETPSKPGYGPEIGRKGLGEIARACARAGARHRRHQSARVGEVMAAGCAGVAVMGGVMRAADPAAKSAR